MPCNFEDLDESRCDLAELISPPFAEITNSSLVQNLLQLLKAITSTSE